MRTKKLNHFRFSYNDDEPTAFLILSLLLMYHSDHSVQQIDQFVGKGKLMDNYGEKSAVNIHGRQCTLNLCLYLYMNYSAGGSICNLSLHIEVIVTPVTVIVIHWGSVDYYF